MSKIYLLVLGIMLGAASYGQYCTTGVGPTDVADSNIESVSLNGQTLNIVDNPACPGVIGVEDQTIQVADLIAGNAYTLNVGWGTCSANYYNGVGEVWIDFDGSQTFDPGELIGSGVADGIAVVNDVFPFVVPALALNGTHRMRVMQEEGGTAPLDPCGTFTWGSVTDYTITITGGSSCGSATALSTSNPTTTTMDLNWTPDGGSIGDNVEWGFPGFTPGTGAEEGSAAGVVGGTTTATGLLPGTTYEFYVETDCGGTQAAWAGPFTFTTAGTCGYFTVSLFDTFGDGWNGGTVDVYINGILFQSGLTVAAGNGPVDYLIPANIGDILSFDYTASGFPTENEITILDQTATVVATEGVGGTTPNDIGDYTIPTGLEACPACPTPTTLATANITGTTIDLSWVEAGTATDWIIEYGPNGFTPGTGTDLVTTNNPETVTGLSSATSYEFYVRAICGVGDTSSYLGPIAGTTTLATLACGSGNPFIIYEQDFEGGFPADWSIVAGTPDWQQNTGTTTSTATGPSGAHSNTGYVYLETSSGVAGATDTLIGPAVDLSSVVDAARLTFYYHMYGATMDQLEVLTSTDNVVWTNQWSITGQQQTDELDPWTPAEIDLTPYTGGFIYIRFVGTRGTSFTGDMAIDLVQVEGCVNCPGPNSLVASNVTGTDLDLSWTESGTSTEWIIEYGPTGFTPGTGTTMVTTNNPENVSGLTQLTGYDFYVASICGPGDTSSYAGPVILTTPLNPLNCTLGNATSLLLEDFEGGFPVDWTISPGTPNFQYTTGTTTSTATGPSGAHSNTGYIYLETSSGGVGATDTLSVPSVDLTSTVADARATFYYHMYGATMSKFAFEVSTDGVLWTEVWSDSGEVQTDELDPWLAAEADLTPYTGNVVQMRFIGTRGTSFTGDMALDLFEVEACISCPNPTALNVSNETTTTVDLDWTNGGTETAWIIEYGPAGFTPGTGTQVPATGNPETVTGLIDNTNYDFYVYADCGSGDVSTPNGPVNTNTLIVCPAPTAFAFTYEGVDTVATTWTPGGLESSWNVEYGPLGYTPGSGTGHVATILPDSTFNIPTGIWEFYVQADCGGGLNNPWAGPLLYISPIQNDSTCDAIPVPVDGSTSTFANVNATEQVGSPVSGFNTVWFTFVAPATGHVQISTCGTDNNFNTMLEVYETTDCADFLAYTFIDGATGNPFGTCTGTATPAGINLCGLAPGNTYYLVVGAENALDEGVFPLTLTELPAVVAGVATPQNVCEDNAAFDMFTTIAGNLTTNGQWYNPVAAPGNEITSTVNIVGAPAGVYPFFYVDIEICGSDTVETAITVIELPNVGMGSTLNAGCNYGSVNLYDGLSGTVDLGGTWYDASSTDLGGGTADFSGEAAGSYDFYYVVDNGTCAADTATVVVDIIDCTNLDENAFNLDVYPNPVRDVLNIRIDNLDGNTTVQLISINGEAITAPEVLVTNVATIEMSDIARGVYFLRVTNNGTTQEVRVVKQ